METKNCNLLELKFHEDDAETMTFEGYGAVFGNTDAHGDVIMPGAFAESLAEASKSGQMPAMLLQHGGMFGDDMTPIGVWSEMSEDGHGLKVKGKLASTTKGKDSYELLKMGAFNGLSIGYRVKEFENRTKPDEPRRTLKKVDLIEVSLVTFPANGKARVQTVKSIDELEKPADVEGYLREAGFSRNEAKHLIAKIKNVDLREAEASSELASLLKRNLNLLRG